MPVQEQGAAAATHMRRSWREPAGPDTPLVTRTSMVPGSVATVSITELSCMLARRMCLCLAANPVEAAVGVPEPEGPASSAIVSSKGAAWEQLAAAEPRKAKPGGLEFERLGSEHPAMLSALLVNQGCC